MPLIVTKATADPETVKRHREQPDDYWRNESFVRKYVIRNVAGPLKYVCIREYDALSFLVQAQGVQYLTTTPASILDVGCGHAVRAARLGNYFGCPTTGLDYSEPFLNQAKAIMSQLPDDKKITLIKGDVEDMQFDDNSFDVVISYGLLMSMKNIDKAVAEIMRVAKLGFVSIEETDVCMTPEQFKAFENIRTKIYPGRIHWHDYLKAFGKQQGMVYTPIVAPDSWDMGEPPAYARYIVVKGVT